MSELLSNTFFSYAGAQGEIAFQTYLKIFQDLHLTDCDLTPPKLRLIFQKFKGERPKIDFEGFRASLASVARQKGLDLDQIEAVLVQSKGPKVRGTTPKPTRLHDDKSTYTGTFKQGGLTIVDTGRTRIGDLSQIVDRGEVDVRGVNSKFYRD